MSSILMPGTLPGPETLTSSEYLQALKGGVDIDGEAAHFDVQFTNQAGFRAVIPFETMPIVLAEIRAASSLMLRRQRWRADRGHQALLALVDTALRPAEIDLFVDPVSQDRIFVHQFYDHAPLALRVSPLEAATNMGLIAKRLASLAH